MSTRRDQAVLVSWSSGKDSAYALEVALREGMNVVELLCTLNAEADRVAMHAVRRELLLAQAERVGLPLRTLELPAACTHAQYDVLMARALEQAEAEGIRGMLFGDLFLEDVRRYRIEMLRRTSIKPLFPIWGRDTSLLAREMIASGTKAIVTCVDPRKLEGGFAGRAFDTELLDELPDTVDPCGENGEFHTFVWDSPSFTRPISVDHGIVIHRDGFVFADVVPNTAVSVSSKER